PDRGDGHREEQRSGGFPQCVDGAGHPGERAGQRDGAESEDEGHVQWTGGRRGRRAGRQGRAVVSHARHARNGARGGHRPAGRSAGRRRATRDVAPRRHPRSPDRRMPSAPPGPYRGGVEDDAPREQVDPRLVDAVLATGMTLAVALVIAADLQRTGRGGATAYGFAVGFGLLVLARRRWPRAVLGLTVLGIFGYYALDLPPIGIALPAVAAL